MSWIYSAIIGFSIGFIMGMIGMYCYDYWRNLREFNERQERYKKLL